MDLTPVGLHAVGDRGIRHPTSPCLTTGDEAELCSCKVRDAPGRPNFVSFCWLSRQNATKKPRFAAFGDGDGHTAGCGLEGAGYEGF